MRRIFKDKIHECVAMILFRAPISPTWMNSIRKESDCECVNLFISPAGFTNPNSAKVNTYSRQQLLNGEQKQTEFER